MALRLVAGGIVLLLLVLSAGGAEAKLPSYVIAGGELGPYAVHVSSLVLDEDDSFPQYLPGDDAQVVEPPRTLPGLSYDLYPSYGNFAIPHQVTNGGPELRYYPENHMLYSRLGDQWYQLGSDGIAFLDAAISDALGKMAAGELEEGPIRAEFRARHLSEVTYRLTSYAVAYEPTSVAECDECVTLSGRSEEFIMRHLVDVVSQPARGTTLEPPTLTVEYYGIVEPPYGGIGGLLGMYTPPTEGRPGRFWAEGYSSETPYYETTPGFDAVIEEALRLAREWPDPPLVAVAFDGEDGSAISLPVVWIGVAAAVVAAMSATVVVVYRRARRRVA